MDAPAVNMIEEVRTLGNLRDEAAHSGGTVSPGDVDRALEVLKFWHSDVFNRLASRYGSVVFLEHLDEDAPPTPA